jgi:aspartokinase
MAARTNLALLKVKTMELEETPGIVSRIAQALHSKNINIYGIFTITSGIQVFVDMNSAKEALTAVREALKDLHNESFETKPAEE